MDFSLAECCSFGYVRPGDDQYYEGLMGIFTYAHYTTVGVLNTLAKKNILLSRSDIDFYDVHHFEKLAGINLFIPSSYNPTLYSPSAFRHYNPKFIKWASKKLIPPASFSIDGITSNFVYSHFSRFFRLLTESYLSLKSSGNYDEQAKTYINTLKNENLDIDGLDYLDHHYSDYLTHYKVPSTSEVVSPFEPSMAFGFWLRRNIDGTHDEIYKGLSKIMKRFDKKWFKNIRKSY